MSDKQPVPPRTTMDGRVRVTMAVGEVYPQERVPMNPPSLPATLPPRTPD